MPAQYMVEVKMKKKKVRRNRRETRMVENAAEEEAAYIRTGSLRV